MKTTHRLIAGCVAALVVASAARAAEWTEDYAGAVARARKEHKLILLDFTGSDWCIWCQRTDAEVFATKEFKDFADKKLVLVRLDYPLEHPQSDAIKARNAAMLDKFGVRAFPTLVALDPSGNVVFSQEGYKEGGPASLISKFSRKGS
jgi:thioredoxin-related protein